MLFGVVVKVDKSYVGYGENYDKIIWLYKTLNIANYSNGSIVAMKDSDWWLDYRKVPFELVQCLLHQIGSIDDRKLKKHIVVQINAE
jgi:hypothetical protein